MSPAKSACPRCHLAFENGELFCPRDGSRLVPASGETSEADDDPRVGSLLAERYRVLWRIGEGGMGTVYEAQHVVLEKRVALEVLRRDVTHWPAQVAGFRRQARAASRLGHPHIVEVSDFGVTDDGAHFFVMELLSGHDLAVELERREALPTQRALSIALQCAEALRTAHDAGVVHGDLRPENVFLVQHGSEGDFVKLAGFGSAALREAEPALAYAGERAPVTARPRSAGEAVDPRVDVYALGAILYELIGGCPLLRARALHETDAIPPLSQVNPACAAPPELDRLLARALAARPEDRHASMRELADECAALLQRTSVDPAQESLPVPAALAPSLRPASAAPRWLRVGVIAALLALGGLAVHELRAHRVVTPPPWAALDDDDDDFGPAETGAAAPELPDELAGVIAAPVREVAVEVRAEPTGARVKVDGREVCAATPCRFHAPRGALVRVATRRPGFRLETVALTPDERRQRVELVLEPLPERTRDRTRGELMLPDALAEP